MTRCYDITARLRAIMQKRGLKTSQLAQMAGITHKIIWWWLKEPGHRTNVKNVRKVAAALRIAPSELAPDYREYGIDDSFYSGAPCGMKRALEIINGDEGDYLDNPAPVAHYPQPPTTHLSHTGKYVQ